MQKNKFKKIITAVYLTTFLFGLFCPFGATFAQDATTPLVIIAEPSNTIKQNENVKITAKIYTGVGGETVSFGTTSILSSFTPTTSCTVPTVPQPPAGVFKVFGIQSCFVNFKTG